MKTLDWTKKLEDKIVAAISRGAISGLSISVPDDHVETGLAHVFFYGDTVYKLYKTHHELGHFIKRVLVPTKERSAFLQQDFARNQHFGGSVYRAVHSVRLEGDCAVVYPYDQQSLFALFEMDRLDFSDNLHEQLLRSEISEETLEQIGYETARLVDIAPGTAQETVSWYEIANERISFLEQFLDWLEDVTLQKAILDSGIFAALKSDLQKHKTKYELIRGDALVSNIDCHDENVFVRESQPVIIDTVPPMSCWWFGITENNLSSLYVNVEVLHSQAAAEKIRQGFSRYHGRAFTDEDIAFTRAFALTISAIHFGALGEKNEIGWRYARYLPDAAHALMSAS